MRNQPHAQPIRSPICLKHNEAVKGVCFFPGLCEGRLICRTCRKSHDSNHLNHYEELEDLINGNLVYDVKTDFDNLMKVIDSQDFAYENNSRLLLGQIDYLFKEIQTHILQKLEQTRDTLSGIINKKLEKNQMLKQRLTDSLNEMTSHYEKAIGSNFSPQSTANDMVQSLCNAQAIRDSTKADPELQAQQTIEYNITHLATMTSGSLFQQIKLSLDQIYQDIVSSFTINNTTKQGSIPKGQLLKDSVHRLEVPGNGTSMNIENSKMLNFENDGLSRRKDHTVLNNSNILVQNDHDNMSRQS